MSGCSFLEGNQEWLSGFIDADTVTNLAWSASGNRYIADSVKWHVQNSETPDMVWVNWSGLNRVDWPLPVEMTPDFQSRSLSENRVLGHTRYWSTGGAPFMGYPDFGVDTPLTRMMYQERAYRMIRRQNLWHIVRLQTFLRARGIEFVFTFMYDYTCKDWDYDHLQNRENGSHYAKGTCDAADPIYQMIDQSRVVSPAGLDWAYRQADGVITEDGSHLTKTGMEQRATQLRQNYQQRLTDSQKVL